MITAQPSTNQIPKENLFARAPWLVALSALVGILPIWLSQYPPGVDFPQYAGQLYVIKHLIAQDPQYTVKYTLNWATPYWLGYILVTALAYMVSIVTAIKIALVLEMWSTTYITYLILNEEGTDPRWAFLTVLFYFNMPFYFGFVNFLISIPLSLWVYLLVVRRSKNHNEGTAISLFVSMLLLFSAHALTWAYILGLCFCRTMATDWNVKKTILRIWPLMLTVPIALLWWVFTIHHANAENAHQIYWGWGVYRFSQLPNILLITHQTGFAWGVVAFIALVPLLSGFNYDVRAQKMLPFLYAAAMYGFAPHSFQNISFIQERFIVYIPLLLIFMIRFNATSVRAKVPHKLVTGAVYLILGMVVINNGIIFQGFNQETRNFQKIEAEIPAHSHVLSMEVDRFSRFLWAPVFLHFPVWLQAECGAQVDFSFASLFNEVVIYRHPSSIPFGFEWMPAWFDWKQLHGSEFDYFVARFPVNPQNLLFKAEANKVIPVLHDGEWYLFKKKS